MSSLAYVDRAARGRSARRSLIDACSRRGSDIVLAVMVMAVAAGFLAYLVGTFNVDTWLELVAGREVWQSGVPHHETLTALSHGAAWVDQQWLSELAGYGIYALGGLALLGLVNVLLLVGAIGGAVVAARKLGAHPVAVQLTLPLCLWLTIPSREVRTQTFVIPLFLATIYLLARDARRPSRGVLWCLPILVLWANLHGTVTLGAGLVALRGLTMLWERRSRLLREPPSWRMPLALLLGAPVCLLATPYGFSILSYYHTMLIGSTVRHAVTEWQPITTEWIIAVPFFALAALVTWASGRWAPRTRLWERLALIVLAAGSVSVIRNVLFFALAALVILPLWIGRIPRWLDSSSDDDPVRAARLGRINVALLTVSALALLIAIASTLLRPAHAYEFSYERTGVLSAVRSATSADPSLKVFTDVRFADWLLWRDPALRGRIANDARFELLTPAQMRSMQRLVAALGPRWKQGAAGYRLLVLDRDFTPEAVQGFLAEPGVRILYDDGERLVILRESGRATR